MSKDLISLIFEDAEGLLKVGLIVIVGVIIISALMSVGGSDVEETGNNIIKSLLSFLALYVALPTTLIIILVWVVKSVNKGSQGGFY